jgi:hypothetical protein
MVTGQQLDTDACAAGNDEDHENEEKGGDPRVQVIVKGLM